MLIDAADIVKQRTPFAALNYHAVASILMFFFSVSTNEIKNSSKFFVIQKPLTHFCLRFIQQYRLNARTGSRHILACVAK